MVDGGEGSAYIEHGRKRYDWPSSTEAEGLPPKISPSLTLVHPKLAAAPAPRFRRGWLTKANPRWPLCQSLTERSVEVEWASPRRRCASTCILRCIIRNKGTNARRYRSLPYQRLRRRHTESGCRRGGKVPARLIASKRSRCKGNVGVRVCAGGTPFQIGLVTVPQGGPRTITQGEPSTIYTYACISEFQFWTWTKPLHCSTVANR